MDEDCLRIVGAVLKPTQAFDVQFYSWYFLQHVVVVVRF